MTTIQLSVDKELLDRVDQATRLLGVPRAKFIEQAIERSLQNLSVSELERQQTEGYRRQPVKPGEFDVWTIEQTWGDR
jgi:metal-responsive CopG/Arc/MetJ family transcriptional regulator